MVGVINYELGICSFTAFQALLRRLKKSLSGGYNRPQTIFISETNEIKYMKERQMCFLGRYSEEKNRT